MSFLDPSFLPARTTPTLAPAVVATPDPASSDLLSTLPSPQLTNPLATPDTPTPPTGALIPNLPSAMKAVQRKYGNGTAQALAQHYDPKVVRALIKYETQRASQGVSPLGPEQTLAAIKAAQTRQAQTKAPERDPWDLLGNAAADVGQLVSNIPKLPSALVHEVQDLPNFQKEVAANGGGLEGLLSAPGIRMIPGAYTAKNLLTGNLEEAISHPVMTALDVAPALKAAGVGEALGRTELGQAAKGAVESAKSSLGATTVGQMVRESFAPSTRELSAMMAEEGTRIAQAANPNFADLHPDALSQLRRDTTKWGYDTARAIPDPIRREAITTALRTDARGLDSLNLNDAEQAAVNGYMNITDAYRKFGESTGNLAERVVQGAPETYTIPQTKRLDALSNLRTRTNAFTSTREAIVNPEAPLPDVREQLLGDGLSVSKKKDLAKGYVHALDAKGYDTGDLLSRAGTLNRSSFEQWVADADPTNLTPRGTATSTRRSRAAAGWARDNRRYTTARVTRTEAQVSRAEARVVPGRFQPDVEQAFNARVVNRVKEVSATGPEAEDNALLAQERNYDMLVQRGVVDPDELRAWQQDARESWVKMRAEGIDPVFVHRVSPQTAASINRPATISSIVSSPSQYRERTFDFTPGTDDILVGVTHQGLELAREAGTHAFLDAFRERFGRAAIDIKNEFLPQARARAARRGTSVPQELETLVRREYVKFNDAASGFTRGGKFNFSHQFGNEDILVPRHLARAMERVAAPPGYVGALNPIINVFRTSVLPFSPRWHINNIAGGAIMAAVEDPRILLQIPRAYKVASELRKMNVALGKGLDYTLPNDVLDVVKSMSPKMRASLSTLESASLPDDLFRFNSGAKLGQMFNDARASRIGTSVDNMLAPIQKVGGKFVQQSFAYNQMFDDMYRSAAYLSGQQGAFAKGLDATEAAARGEALVMKTMPRWNELTPMERTVFRAVFPFYSFLNHIIRYAWRYPIDHPFRTAVAGSLVRQEMDDFGTGLPQSLASAFFLGSPDSSGNVTAIDPGAANPFRDLGDNLTIAGFLSQTNPAFKMVLQQLGYDPRTKGPELYPELVYDPKTGGLKAKTPNTPGLLGGALAGIIPQAQILGALTGTSSEFKSLLSTNPAAAKRLLLSSAGIPILWKNVNLYDTAFKTETTRGTAQHNALSKALKSGATNTAYPALNDLLAQARTLQEGGRLAAFTPPSDAELQQQQQRLADLVAG